LYAAAEGGYEEVVEVLLRAGAEVGLTRGNPKGWTALKVATVRGYQGAVELLEAVGKNLTVGEKGVALLLAGDVGVRGE
jgi:hypothetical protein